MTDLTVLVISCRKDYNAVWTSTPISTLTQPVTHRGLTKASPFTLVKELGLVTARILGEQTEQRKPNGTKS